MDYLAVIGAEGERIAAVARRGPLDARIPHMKRWTLGDVVAHLGGVHRWAESIVAERHYDGRGHRRGTETGEALIAWFEEGLELLSATLGAAHRDEKCGNFSPGSPDKVGFWHRRQAHETTMHRWDAEAAVGGHAPIAADLASDGIDELFHTFTRGRGKQVLGAPIAIVATDTGATWTLAPTSQPGRVDLVTEPVEATATVSGPAEPLLLALWKRIPMYAAGLTVSGSEEMARAFVAGPISP